MGEAGATPFPEIAPLTFDPYRGVKTPTTSVPRYDTKQSEGEASVMLKPLGNAEYPFIVFAPGPLWPGIVTPDRVLCIGQIELFDIDTVY